MSGQVETLHVVLNQADWGPLRCDTCGGEIEGDDTCLLVTEVAGSAPTAYRHLKCAWNDRVPPAVVLPWSPPRLKRIDALCTDLLTTVARLRAAALRGQQEDAEDACAEAQDQIYALDLALEWGRGDEE